MEESGCSGLRLGRRELLYLAFAYDLAIFGDYASDMQWKMTAFEAYCDENQLQINTLKIKVIVLGRRGRRRKMPIMIGGERLEYVSTFTYLGVMISSSLRFKSASEHFISRSHSAVGATLDLMKRGSVVTWSTTNSLFVSSVESVLFYAVELWMRYLNSLEVVEWLFEERAFSTPIYSWPLSPYGDFSSSLVCPGAKKNVELLQEDVENERQTMAQNMPGAVVGARWL
ncbi:hypothetical protein GE061_000963 [Apolygus lucorum]|uniref:Uncharacterized protein n=1 Tax=Apolygus lucorum TaxID=248454 RepID=A0A6A4K859_APOLU|nr:hypothetical protein GE061_000963 [Apolygus lucorum]